MDLCPAAWNWVSSQCCHIMCNHFFPKYHSFTLIGVYYREGVFWCLSPFSVAMTDSLRLRHWKKQKREMYLLLLEAGGFTSMAPASWWEPVWLSQSIQRSRKGRAACRRKACANKEARVTQRQVPGSHITPCSHGRKKCLETSMNYSLKPDPFHQIPARERPIHWGPGFQHRNLWLTKAHPNHST